MLLCFFVTLLIVLKLKRFIAITTYYCSVNTGKNGKESEKGKEYIQNRKSLDADKSNGKDGGKNKQTTKLVTFYLNLAYCLAKRKLLYFIFMLQWIKVADEAI